MVSVIVKENESFEKALRRFKKKWEPYCSVATWYLWRSIDPVAVEY